MTCREGAGFGWWEGGGCRGEQARAPGSRHTDQDSLSLSPSEPSCDWTNLRVLLGLDVGFDAGRRRSAHAALVDGVLANWGGRWRVEKKKTVLRFSED